jgi:hypothetical protein
MLVILIYGSQWHLTGHLFKTCKANHVVLFIL